MKNGFITRTRIILIELGKLVPFLICAVVLVSYIENIYALFIEDYIMFDGVVYLNKPVSWFIGQYFKYDLPSLVVITILSIAIETCIYNKLACVYLGVNLYEKQFFSLYEFDNEIYYIVAIANVIICTLLCYKGINILIRK